MAFRLVSNLRHRLARPFGRKHVAQSLRWRRRSFRPIVPLIHAHDELHMHLENRDSWMKLKDGTCKVGGEHSHK